MQILYDNTTQNLEKKNNELYLPVNKENIINVTNMNTY